MGDGVIVMCRWYADDSTGYGGGTGYVVAYLLPYVKKQSRGDGYVLNILRWAMYVSL